MKNNKKKVLTVLAGAFVGWRGLGCWTLLIPPAISFGVGK